MAISQGNLTIRVTETEQVSQPNAFATQGRTETVDRTSVALRLAPAPPAREAQLAPLRNTHLRIAAGDPHHEEKHTHRFEADAHILSLRPHMHYRGKSWRFEATYPDGREEIRPVLGVYRFDEDGLPVPGDDFVPLLVHEVCHSYVNPVVDRHAERLRKAGEESAFEPPFVAGQADSSSAAVDSE